MMDIIARLDQAKEVILRTDSTYAEVVTAACEALAAAASAMQELNERRFRDAVDNPLLRATGYRTEIDMDDKVMRLSFFHGAEDNILSWMIMPVEQIYNLSEKCLKMYDKLEGIK